MAKSKSAARKSAAKKAAKTRKPRAAAKKAAAPRKRRAAAKKALATRKPKAVVAAVATTTTELDDRIAIVRTNLRELVEQATSHSGASDEERMSERIAEQEAKLELLIKQREGS